MSWRVAGWLSRVLEPAEREAVLGDLAESRASGAEALRDMLGLVARRQAALWLDWRPWLALAIVVVPLGTLLGTSAILASHEAAVPLWMYTDNWTPTYWTNPGARLDLVQIAAGIVFRYFVLACWSWTTGFVLGAWSRRSVPVTGALFCLALAQPQFSWHSTATDSPVFALKFYSTVFPVLVLLVLDLLPALWGMRHGLRLASFQPGIRRILGILSIAALVPIAVESWLPSLPRFLVPLYLQLAGLHGQRLRLLSLLTYWPVAYLVVNAIAQRKAVQEKNA